MPAGERDLETATSAATLPSDPKREGTLPYGGDDANVPATFGRYSVTRPLGSGGMGLVLEAHDPSLDRRVAIKLLRPDVWGGATGGEGRERLAREAQAMAKLSHPNVVTVYEVGELDDRPFLAMELIDGETLRTWQASHRPRREILAMYVAAGRGLAAAHAAGLVHRDFKPENVLVGADGRPRVTDFGLVVAGAIETTAERDPTDDDSVDTTTRGTLAGTPAYMSAEQWAGQVDPRSDQYSFCVALWEALWGQRPFPAGRRDELHTAVRAGVIVSPPRDRGVPRWLETVLRRGLATDPAARWPSVTALLDEIERYPRQRRRLAIAAVAAAGVALTASATMLATRSDPDDPCTPPTAQVAAIWSPDRGAALAHRLDTIDPALGRARFLTASAAFDRAARSVTEMHVDACHANRDRRQSDTLLDRRMRCMDRWLAELDGTIGVVERAPDPAGLDGAMLAISGLSPLAACADADALLAVLPPPVRPDDRIEAEAITRAVQEVEIARRAGQSIGLVDRARALVVRARKLGHAPTLAATLLTQALSESEILDGKAALATLNETIQVAAEGHDDLAAADAWARVVRLTGTYLHRPEQAQLVLPAAQAALARAGNPLTARVDLLVAIASVLDDHVDIPKALDYLAQAKQLLLDAGANGAGSPYAVHLATVLNETAIALVRKGNPREALAPIEESNAIFARLLGPDHPSVASGYYQRSRVLGDLGRRDEALHTMEQALRIREARTPGTPVLAVTLAGVGTAWGQLGKHADGIPFYERAATLGRATMSAADPELAQILSSYANALGKLFRFDESAKMFDEAIAVLDRAKARTSNLPITIVERADMLKRKGDCPGAIEGYRRSIPLFEELVGKDTAYLIYPLQGLGSCLNNLKQWEEARGVLERCLAVPTQGMGKEYQTMASSELGLNLTESGVDRTRGVKMVAAARDKIRGWGVDVAQYDAWLRAHGGR